ncbi:MAG: alkyl hydroperoxide reductase/Thiol specific antioxidant/Mal allergen [Cytophagaceae bacterium]|jgi:hypothetical protein|nr:alkyl hydroperoxide reductase/Thiol specific antioxidant/Mal allergen [Cytophagaceae bacterium]
MRTRTFVLLWFITSSVVAQEWPTLQQRYRLKRISSVPVLEKKQPEYYIYYFFSPECPLCINYSIAVKEWEDSLNIQTVVILPGKQVKKLREEYMTKYLSDQQVYQDATYRFSQHLQVTVTPEVVLTDAKGAVLYKGLIDDWVTALGVYKKKAEHYYLREAIAACRNGEQYTKETSPIGCFIVVPNTTR